MELINIFTIWVTTACNMRCKYCYEGNAKKISYMTEDVAYSVVKWIISRMRESKSVHSVIRFHGGEPTLNMPILRYIVDRLNNEDKNFKFDYHLTSNGYSIKDEDIAYLAKEMADISISLDGKKEINDMYRIDGFGQGTFDKVLDNAKNLRYQFPKLWIRMTVNPQTCNKLEENVFYFLKEGFSNISIVPDFTSKNWTVELIDDLEEQCKSIWGYMEKKKIESNIVLPLNKDLSQLSICMGGTEKFEIDVFGKLYPCTYVIGEEEYCLGDIYNGVDVRTVEKIKRVCKQSINICEGCGGYNSCTAVRCKFVNKKVTNDYFIPIPLICELHRREGIIYLEKHR